MCPEDELLRLVFVVVWLPLLLLCTSSHAAGYDLLLVPGSPADVLSNGRGLGALPYLICIEKEVEQTKRNGVQKCPEMQNKNLFGKRGKGGGG